MDTHEEHRVILPSFSLLTQNLKAPDPLPAHILALRNIGPLAPLHHAHPGLAHPLAATTAPQVSIPFDPDLTIREIMLFDVPDAAEVINILIEAHRREHPVNEARKRWKTDRHTSSANTTPSTVVNSLESRAAAQRWCRSVNTEPSFEVGDGRISINRLYETQRAMTMTRTSEHHYRHRVSPELSILDLLESNKAKINTTDDTACTTYHSPSGHSGFAEGRPRIIRPIEEGSTQRPRTSWRRTFPVQQVVLHHDDDETSSANPGTHVRWPFETKHREPMSQPAQLQQITIPAFADYDISGPPAQFQIPFTQAAVGEQLRRRKPGPRQCRSRRVNRSTQKTSAPKSPTAPAPAPTQATGATSRAPSPRAFVLSGGVSLYASAGPPVVPDVRDQDVEQLSGPGVAGRKRLRPTYEEIYDSTSAKRRRVPCDDEYAGR
ncbi:hypothetical protein PsYK624_054070 [Phanerochaete sordida]|uniref:Rhodanese domain-containing protein n=1 Tax=Phanerochaete sordida TaxID=48140 RepID=A0A9P3G8B5_9APHY|nr:hypothetical protein PsYK624_054070 [Phanerochaete sordida]